MKNKLSKDGFTLVEILVAVALIAAILSMVYGSYFAASKSAQVCKAKIAMSQQGRTTLEQMAQQIRCSYAGTMTGDADSVESGSQQTEIVPEDSISYFSGDSDAPNREILHLVTTKGFTEEKGTTHGLFEITYKFDKNTRILSLSQTGFVGTAKKIEERSWKPIADNIERLELAFFDGQRWLHSWDFKDNKKLPRAVRIEISGKDEGYRRYHCGTVAYVSCQKNWTGTKTETFATANRQ